jgi:hypothetical protein
MFNQSILETLAPARHAIALLMWIVMCALVLATMALALIKRNLTTLPAV